MEPSVDSFIPTVTKHLDTVCGQSFQHVAWGSGCNKEPPQNSSESATKQTNSALT